jgi:hypothetical protein
MPPKAPIFREPWIGSAFGAILQGIGKKQLDREVLLPGDYPFELSIIGEIKKRKVAVHLEGGVVVEHDHDASSTAAPTAKVLLGWWLWKTNPEVRKLNLLNLKTAFEKGDLEPTVPEEFLELAEETLAALRKTVQKSVTGAVRLGTYSLSKPSRGES